MGQPRLLGPNFTEPTRSAGKTKKKKKGRAQVDQAHGHYFSTAQAHCLPLFSEPCATLKKRAPCSEPATDPSSGEAPVVLRSRSGEPCCGKPRGDLPLRLALLHDYCDSL